MSNLAAEGSLWPLSRHIDVHVENGAPNSLHFYGANISIVSPEENPNPNLNRTDIAVLGLSAAGLDGKGIVDFYNASQEEDTYRMLIQSFHKLGLRNARSSAYKTASAFRAGILSVRQKLELPHELNPGVRGLPVNLTKIIGGLASNQSDKEIASLVGSSEANTSSLLDTFKTAYGLPNDAAAVTFGFASKTLDYDASRKLVLQPSTEAMDLQDTELKTIPVARSAADKPEVFLANRAVRINWRGGNFDLHLDVGARTDMQLYGALWLVGESKSDIAEILEIPAGYAASKHAEFMDTFSTNGNPCTLLARCLQQHLIHINRPPERPAIDLLPSDSDSFMYLLEGLKQKDVADKLQISTRELVGRFRLLRKYFSVKRTSGVILLAYACGMIDNQGRLTRQ